MLAPELQLLWEERERLGVVSGPWGPYIALLASRRGGWAVLENGYLGPKAKVVELNARTR